jgi:hypothetical protein
MEACFVRGRPASGVWFLGPATWEDTVFIPRGAERTCCACSRPRAGRRHPEILRRRLRPRASRFPSASLESSPAQRIDAIGTSRPSASSVAALLGRRDCRVDLRRWRQSRRSRCRMKASGILISCHQTLPPPHAAAAKRWPSSTGVLRPGRGCSWSPESTRAYINSWIIRLLFRHPMEGAAQRARKYPRDDPARKGFQVLTEKLLVPYFMVAPVGTSGCRAHRYPPRPSPARARGKP